MKLLNKLKGFGILKDENGRVIYQESSEKTIDDVWRMSMLQPADKEEPVGYATQKPEAIAITADL